MFKCPKCKYILSYTELAQIKEDFGCPRCRLEFNRFTSFEDFTGTNINMILGNLIDNTNALTEDTNSHE